MKAIRNLAMCYGLILFSGCSPRVYEAGAAVAAGPGYWFFIILVVLPLGVVLFKLFSDLGEIKESLLGLEGQLRRVNSRIEELENMRKEIHGESGEKPE
jgi:hypothetical protein